MSEEFWDRLYKNLGARGETDCWCCWFVGLIEGEASFTYQTHKKQRHILPRFSMNLQGDFAMLQEIDSIIELGRQNVVNPHRRRKDGSLVPARMNFDIRRKEWLANTVEFFVKYPLRSKKKDDFAIWKLLVNEYVEKGGNHKRMFQLALQLSETGDKTAASSKIARKYLREVLDDWDKMK